MNGSVAQYVTFAAYGVTAVVAVLLVLWGVRAGKPRFVRPAQIVVALLPFGVAWLVMATAGFGVAPMYAGGAAAVGLVAGLLAGRSAKVVSAEGRVVVRPSKAIAWIAVLEWLALAVALALVGPNLASAVMLVVLAVSAASLAEAVMHLLGRGKVRTA